jgi:hypothetical protein
MSEGAKTEAKLPARRLKVRKAGVWSGGGFLGWSLCILYYRGTMLGAAREEM